MQKLADLTASTRTQYGVFLGIAVVIAVMTGWLYVRNAPLFRPLLGKLNPLIAIGIVTCLGIALLALLLPRGWFVVYRAGNSKGLLTASALAALLGAMIVMVDLVAVFPANTNRPFPDSLLFYPVFAYIVEVVFHLLPLSLLLLVLTPFRQLSFENVIWPCMILVACIEPTFQTILGSSRPYPTWLVIYVWVHIFAINLLQLLMLKRYDFCAMFLFRLVYYAIWHTGWGVARLNLLF